MALCCVQLFGLVFRVSCATPVLGPAVGLLGVGFANALAGQASKHTRKLLVDKANPNKPGFWEAPDPEDVVLDALLGAAIFKVRLAVLGGRCLATRQAPWVVGWCCGQGRQAPGDR